MLSGLLELLLVLFLGVIGTYDTIMSKKRANRKENENLISDPLITPTKFNKNLFPD